MGSYSSFYTFENPRRGRQARNLTKKCSENSRCQIVFRTEIFSKIVVGCPCCNVDDLDTSHGFAGVKVVICYPSGEVSVKSAIDNESQRVIKNISLKKWKTVANELFLHEHLAPELKRVFSEEIARECKNYSSSDDSCLKYRSPDQLAVFSNKTLCKEVETHLSLTNISNSV